MQGAPVGCMQIQYRWAACRRTRPSDVCRARRRAFSMRLTSTDPQRDGDVESDSSMKVCIFGAGAIGGFIGAKLASTVHRVSAVARGATAAALREHGFRVNSGGVVERFDALVAEDPAELGVQDVVVISVKAPSLPGVAERIAPLLGEETIVLVAMNGVPWWFFSGFGGEHAGLQLESVDPGGLIARAIPAKAVVGCVGPHRLLHAGARPRAAQLRQHPDRRRALGRGLAPRGVAGQGADRGRLRHHGVAADPEGRLVQVVGQHDHQPDVGAHRRHRRPAARRPAGAALLHAGDGRGGRRRRPHRLPDRADRRRPHARHPHPRRPQDLDAAGRRSPPSRGARRHRHGGARDRPEGRRTDPPSPTPSSAWRACRHRCWGCIPPRRTAHDPARQRSGGDRRP